MVRPDAVRVEHAQNEVKLAIVIPIHEDRATPHHRRLHPVGNDGPVGLVCGDFNPVVEPQLAQLRLLAHRPTLPGKLPKCREPAGLAIRELEPNLLQRDRLRQRHNGRPHRIRERREIQLAAARQHRCRIFCRFDSRAGRPILAAGRGLERNNVQVAIAICTDAVAFIVEPDELHLIRDANRNFLPAFHPVAFGIRDFDRLARLKRQPIRRQIREEL